MDMLDRLLDAETNVGRVVRLVHFLWRTHMGIPCFIAFAVLFWVARGSMYWKLQVLWANVGAALFILTLLSHVYDSRRFSDVKYRYHDFQNDLEKERVFSSDALAAKSRAVDLAIERLGKWLRPVNPDPK